MAISFNSIPFPLIVETDFQSIYDDLVSAWETYTGSTLPAVCAERLWVIATATMIKRERDLTNDAVRQCYAAFASGDALDNIGLTVGVERNSASDSTCTIQCDFSGAAPTSYTLEAGIQIQSSDGLFIWTTDDAVNISAGETSLTVDATCTTAGASTNDYAAGMINDLQTTIGVDYLDLGNWYNTSASTGGFATETDDSYRERILLAGTIKSTAGAQQSYEYWAKTYSTSIASVSATQTAPGEVTIYTILQNGSLPNAAFLSGMQDFLDGETVRPLCDTVICAAPSVVNYTISVAIDYYKAASGNIDQIVADALVDVTAWADQRKQQIGKDIVPEQIVGIIQPYSGVYRVRVVSPSYQQIASSEVAQYTSIAVVKGVEYEENQ